MDSVTSSMLDGTVRCFQDVDAWHTGSTYDAGMSVGNGIESMSF